MRARLYLDEDFLPAAAQLLRLDGEDVISAHEIGALSIPDDEQLLIAAGQGRAIVTSNTGDFRALSEYCWHHGIEHAGIVLSYRQYTRNQVTVVSRALLRLLDTIDAETLAGSVQVLDLFRTDP